MNLTACGLLGVERRLLVRKPFALFVHPESQDLFYLHKRQVLEATTRQTCQLVLKRKDGTFFDAQLESIAAQVEGTPVIRTILTDITERKQAERERKLLESQLRQARKMEALGTLTGGIAHEFNNALAAIIGFTDLVAGHAAKGGRDEHYLKRITEAAIRSRQLVQQMLTFTRQAGQEKEPLRLSSIVRETVNLLRASTPGTIDIRIDVRSESGLISGDPVQIRQVLMNLCTNAIFAMRETGGFLDIALSDFTLSPSSGDPLGIKPGHYMKLTVRDTGSGIAPDIIDRIFDPFFTTKKFGEATGLGLSVVHGIVNQSGGSITVASEPGKGSTFTLYFPLIASE